MNKKAAQSMMLATLILLIFYTIALTYQSKPVVQFVEPTAQGVHLINAPEQHGVQVQTNRTVQNNATDSARDRFAVIFDAGSTGTRVHVLQFRQEVDGKSFHVLSEFFEQVKPGLSSYADEPAKGVASLKKLVEKAKDKVPSERMADTPIALRATAGLRLLPSDSANELLDKVTEYFRRTPFKVLPNCASIMDGVSEGFFLWFTVNLLKGSLGFGNELDVLKTVGSLDLGGGSTQITFLPHQHATLLNSPAGFVKIVGLFNQHHKVYSHSYLELGLKSARLKIMGAPDISQINSGEDYSTLEYQLVSQCLSPSYHGRLEHGAITFRVAGDNYLSSNRFEACYEMARRVVNKVHRPAEVKLIKFYALSYYVDIAVDAGLIELNESKEVTIKVRDYYWAAKKECQAPNVKTPFLCIDLTYISALLRDGFGFEDTTELVVANKLNGIEMSWALGAAINTLEQLDTSQL